MTTQKRQHHSQIRIPYGIFVTKRPGRLLKNDSLGAAEYASAIAHWSRKHTKIYLPLSSVEEVGHSLKGDGLFGGGYSFMAIRNFYFYYSNAKHNAVIFINL